MAYQLNCVATDTYDIIFTNTDLYVINDSESVSISGPLQGDQCDEVTAGRVAHEEQPVRPIQTRLATERLRPPDAGGDGVGVLGVLGRLQQYVAARVDRHLQTPTAAIVVHTSKGKFLYSAVSSPQDSSKRFILYIPGRPVHSDTISASLRSIQPYATINARRLLGTKCPM